MTGERVIDVYALTNPVFWALALTQFVTGHKETRGDHAPISCAYPLLFLPMPLVFSQEALSRFEGTNRKTGLLTWLERNPSVRATAGAEIGAAKSYTRSALTFALAHDLLTTPDGWRYSASAARGWKKPAWPAKTDPRGGLLQASHRLGQWCGALDVSMVFIALGVRP